MLAGDEKFMASWYDPFFYRTFETFNISNYTNSWYLYMYFYTSYGFLSVFEIDEDSLHNFNTYLLLSAKLQHMADLSVTNYWDKGTPSSIITCAKFQSVIHACIRKWIKLCHRMVQIIVVLCTNILIYMYTTYPSKMTQEFGQGKKWTSYQSDLSHSLLHFLP